MLIPMTHDCWLQLYLSKPSKLRKSATSATWDESMACNEIPNIQNEVRKLRTNGWLEGGGVLTIGCDFKIDFINDIFDRLDNLFENVAL